MLKKAADINKSKDEIFFSIGLSRERSFKNGRIRRNPSKLVDS